MYIPDHQISAVRTATDIVAIVSDHVRLKKRGSNYVGLCPFHNEKTPSFSVSPGMGIFKCFGCGKGGNVFQFLMEVESLTFPEAARTLAERAGIELASDPEAEKRSRMTESVYEVLRFAGRYFNTQLTTTEEGRKALDYLTERGFTTATIRRFGLGWAPDAWDALVKEAERKHIDTKALQLAGLSAPRQRGDGHYDRFRARVVFPIFSTIGKVIGFGGRTLEAAPDTPKYINSPQTSVYRKGRALYGLFQGKSAIRTEEEAILVEGYTDVLTLHQASIKNAVACSGTALTKEQIRTLSRFARRILLLYDADEAGGKAALRSIELVLPAGLSAYAISLPPGEDPDSFVREHGADEFREYVRTHRQDFVTFIHSRAQRTGALGSPEGEHAAMRATVDAVAKIPDPLQREPFIRRASELFDVPRATLRGALDRKLRPTRAPRSAAEPEAKTAALQPKIAALPPEKALLQLMLTHGESMVHFIMTRMSVREFSEGPCRDVVTRLLEMYETGNVDAQEFLAGREDNTVQQLVAELLAVRHEPSQNWAFRNIHVPGINEDRERAAESAMKRLKLHRIGSVINEHVKRMDRKTDVSQAMQQEMMRLLNVRKHIESGAFLR